MAVTEKYATTSAVITFFFCCFTLGQFVLFLSSHTCLKYSTKYDPDLYKNAGEGGTVIGALLTNLFLLAIFILQHSLQAHPKVKNFLNLHGFVIIERLLYTCGSCICLLLLMYFWKAIPSKTIWEVSTHNHTYWWWLFTSIHFIAWLVTYSGCFIMDITEMLGLKQVYHYILNWPPPAQQKSEGLKRLHTHMRHPSFLALTVILFIHPVMQLDRILLAYAFLIYMIIGFKVDDIDFAYQRRMLHRKYRDLCLNG